jgi:Predicted membrane protein
MLIAVVWVAAALLAFFASDATHWKAGIWIFKPLASAGFVFAAIRAGAMRSPYGQWIIVALLLSLVGDVLLIPRSSVAFRAGLASFLLAHAGFATAFVTRGVSIAVASTALVILAAAGIVVFRWLAPHLPRGMKVPVVAYVVTIIAMVSLAFGTAFIRPSLLIPSAAVCFFVSDLSVARDRFVARGIANRLWGLPLYYAAQLLFAFSA